MHAARSSRAIAFLAVALVIAACQGDRATGPDVTADDAGALFGKKKHQPPPETPPPPPPPAPEPNPTPPPVPNPVAGNPLSGFAFYVDPNSNSRLQVTSWASSRPLDAAQMEKIASRAQSKWMGAWNSDVAGSVDRALTASTAAGTLRVFITYNIPQLDCGSGGATATAYRAWITAFAGAIRGRKAAIVLEPDALPALDCLSATNRQTRIDLIRFAIETFKAQPGVAVYVDAGHPQWKTAADMAARLLSVNVGAADGFSLNVSNFISNADNLSYGQQISALIGGKHFIIDTSRNGIGPTSDFQWCNPSGRGLGLTPSSLTADLVVDAYLWLKTPGESDGTCNGGPSGGTWWPDYALGLAQRSVL